MRQAAERAWCSATCRRTEAPRGCARAALADGPVDILVDNGVSLARELKGTGVTSNVVSPGAILVDVTRELVTSIGPARGWGETGDEIQADAVEALIPSDHGRFGKPGEVAAAYLCSDHTEYVSGATIHIDGGLIRAAF